METDYGPLGEQMKKLLLLTEENNRMLKAARRDKWIGFLVNVTFWVVVLAGSYYFTMQLVGPLLNQFSGASGGESLNPAKLLEQYQDLLSQ